MELKTHETGSASYPGHHMARQTSGSERRRDFLPHNGTPVLSANIPNHQTLDSKHQRLDPNPDPVSFAFSVPSPNPIPTGSKPKSGNIQPISTFRYRECLRNHAASVGGNVYDGCGEFMPSGDEGTIEALKCAACECHRNFHRKEISGERNFSPNLRRNLSSPPPLPLPSPTPIHPHPHHHHRSIIQPVNVVFSGGGGGGGNESSSEDLNPFGSGEIVPSSAYSFSKKRFRTKFTAEQKERMMEFAEKLGWRISKQNDEEVDRFCSEIGVKRQVFKVWMHNNKNTAKGKQTPLLPEEGSAVPAHQHEQQVQWQLNNEDDEDDDEDS